MLEGVRKTGYHAAQLAALGTIVGGAFDLSLRRLLPHHERYLGAGSGEVPAEVEALVLLVLNTLGMALIVVGGLALVLLHVWREHGVRWAAWAAAIGVALASAANAWGISKVGSIFIVGPLLFPILAIGGVALAMRGSGGETRGRSAG